MTDWIKQLANIPDIIVAENHVLASHLPMRVGGTVECWVRCLSLAGIKQALPIIRRQTWRIHWPFEDWLVRDTGLQGCVLRLEGEFEQIRSNADSIELGSASLWSNIPKHATDFAELATWSGSVGASLLHEKAEKLFSGMEMEVEWLQGRHKHRIYYDHTTKFQAPNNSIPLQIKIFRMRKKKNIKPTRNGQLFQLEKNILPSTYLQELSLDSVRLRNWKISTDNPNYVVHTGMGELEDLQLLQKALNQRLQPARNTSLELRLSIFGKK
jgi:UDP-N-acetylenolpyruvoylglucosamine reductase